MIGEPIAVTFVTVLLGFGGDWAAIWRPPAMIVGSRESRGCGDGASWPRKERIINLLL